MRPSVLSRYIDPQLLGRLGRRPLEPRGLVIGNLAGAHKSPLSGFAVEFVGHREYVPGDDLRHLDWRVYFTREKYFVKQYELETNFVCHLLLDISASMFYGDASHQKLFCAAQLAATLGYAVVRQNDKASLATFDDRLRSFLPPSNSADQIARMTERLDEIEPTEKTDLGACLEAAAGRMGRREIVMVFSDFFGDLDRLEHALQRLRYQKHEVVLFHIMARDELAFEFPGEVKFVGLEDNGETLTRPDDIRRDYLAAVDRFQRRLNEIVQRNGCERVLVDTSRELSETLVDYLNQRSQYNRGR